MWNAVNWKRERAAAWKVAVHGLWRRNGDGQWRRVVIEPENKENSHNFSSPIYGGKKIFLYIV